MKKMLARFSWVDLIKPIILILFILFTILKVPTFFTFRNLFDVLSQGVVIGIASLGMSMVIFSGEIDISIGAMIYLTGVLGTQVYMITKSIPFAVLCALSVGAACGFLNGFGVTKLKIPSMITTLAVSNLITGIASLLMGKRDTLVVDDPYKAISQTRIFGQLSGVWIYLVLVALFIIIMSKKKFGRYVYAIGDNADALNSLGISVDRIKIIIFMVTGILCGLAGILATSRLGGSMIMMSVGTEVYCIAAVVVGGASMSGGKGNIIGTFFGSYIVVAIDNLLRLMKTNAYIYDVIWGTIIFSVVLMDILKRRQKIWERSRMLPISNE